MLREHMLLASHVYLSNVYVSHKRVRWNLESVHGHMHVPRTYALPLSVFHRWYGVEVEERQHTQLSFPLAPLWNVECHRGDEWRCTSRVQF